MKLFSCVSFIPLQILGFFHQLVLILTFYGVTVKTKNSFGMSIANRVTRVIVFAYVNCGVYDSPLNKL